MDKSGVRKLNLKFCYRRILLLLYLLIIFGFLIRFLIFYDSSILYTFIISSKVGYSAVSNIPKLPLTLHCNGGRLGNQMGTYATLYGLAHLNNRVPYILPCSGLKLLHKYFNLSLRQANSSVFKECKEHKIIRHLKEEDYKIPKNCSKLTGFCCPFSYTFYNHIRDKILREFTFKPHIRKYAKDVLLEVRKKYSCEVFVGMHIRRSDFGIMLYKYHWKKMDMRYLLDAMAYFKKYQDVTFVVVSDDRKWCNYNLGNLSDVYITPSPPQPGYDMAILAQCNHTIISYGTFGYWGAYLAGGETVYYANHLTPNRTLITDPASYNKTNLPNWVGIGPGFIIHKGLTRIAL